MRYILFILAFLGLSFIGKSQTVTQPGLRDYQLSGATLPDSILFLMGTDTLDGSAKQGLGKWHRADSLLSALGGDTDWWKLNTTVIPTNSDSMERTGYTLLNGLDGGLPTKIEFLKEGILQFDKVDEVSGSVRSYLRVKPLQQSEGNVDWIESITTSENYGDRFNDVHSEGWNILGGSVESAGAHGFGHATEGWFQEDATYLRFEDHTYWYDTDGIQRRPESLVITDGDYGGWYKYFTVGNVFMLDPRNNYKFAEFRIDADTAISTFSMWTPKSANTKGVTFQSNETTNRFNIAPIGTANTTMDVSFFPFSRHALIQRTEVASTYGLTMATIAGNTSDGYFGNITPSYGLTLSSDLLKVDSTKFATQYDLTQTGIQSVEGVSNDGGNIDLVEDWGINITGDDGANTITLQVDSAQVATQYDLTLISGGSDGNGIFDAANEADTIEINEAMIDPALVGFYLSSLGTSNDSYWSYQPFSGGLGMLAYDDQARPSIAMYNEHASYGTFASMENIGNRYLYGLNIGGDFYIQDGTIEPFYIEASTTVDNTLKLQADGDVQIADYPNSRDDGSPTNVLGTDASGVIQSYPVADVGEMDNWLLATGDTGGTETVTNGETVTFVGTTGLDFTRSTNTASVALSIDEFSTDGTIEEDELLLAWDPSGSNHELIDVNNLPYVATEVDGSPTNEAWTIDADDADTEVISNQTVKFEGLGDINTNYIPLTNTLEIEYVGTGGDGNGIFDATNDGSNTPTDMDVGVLDSLEFNGTLKIINDANDYVGIGSQSPEAKLHVRSSSGEVGANLIVEDIGATSYIRTKSRANGLEFPFQFQVMNRDLNVDLTGDFYQMGNITFSKASATVGGGAINFNVGYDSLNLDGVLTLKSRESGATDGLVNVAGGLRFKWRTDATSAATFNTGDYGITMTATGAKTATVPDATSTLVGQTFFIFNSGTSGDITISITGGSGDTILGDVTVAINESVTITCPETGVWIGN